MHSSNHIFPAAGTGPPRWLSNFDMVAKVCFLKQRLHVDWVFASEVCVCVYVCVHSELQARQSTEGVGTERMEKGPGEDERK